MIHRFDPAREQAGAVSIGRPADNTRNLRSRRQPAAGHAGSRRTNLHCGLGGRRRLPGPARADRRTIRRRSVQPRRDYVPRRRPRPLGARTETWNSWDARTSRSRYAACAWELGEIETALTAHPNIRESAVKLVSAAAQEEANHCLRCGLESAHPEAQIDQEGVCAVCRRFDSEKGLADSYFEEQEGLERALADAKAFAKGPHDCVMLYSGGKDSTYALCKIVEMGRAAAGLFF